MNQSITLLILIWVTILTSSCDEQIEKNAEARRPQRNLYGVWELEEAHQNIYVDNQLEAEQFEAIFYQKPVLCLNADGTFEDSAHAVPGLWKFSETKQQLFFDINEGEYGFTEDCHIDELTESSLTYSCITETRKKYHGEEHLVRTEKIMHFIKPSIEL